MLLKIEYAVWYIAVTYAAIIMTLVKNKIKNS